MPDPLPIPAEVLAAAGRQREHIEANGWSPERQIDDIWTLVNYLLTLLPDPLEPPTPRKWTERIEAGISLAWFLSCEGVSHELCKCGLCSLGGVDDYPTEAHARAALAWQYLARLAELTGKGGGK